MRGRTDIHRWLGGLSRNHSRAEAKHRSSAARSVDQCIASCACERTSLMCKRHECTPVHCTAVVYSGCCGGTQVLSRLIGSGQYKVKYTDGDEEMLSKAELLDLLVENGRGADECRWLTTRLRKGERNATEIARSFDCELDQLIGLNTARHPNLTGSAKLRRGTTLKLPSAAKAMGYQVPGSSSGQKLRPSVRREVCGEPPRLSRSLSLPSCSRVRMRSHLQIL